MNRPSAKVTFLALGVAASAWIGAFFFVQSIHGRQMEAAKAINSLRQEHTSAESRNQMTAVFNATEVSRERIKNTLSIDVLTLADHVVAAGKDASVPLRVSNAAPEVIPAQNKGASASISAVNFTIEANGSFTQLFNALALLEALPIPARIEEASLTQLKSETEPWNLKVRLRILTTLPINS